jgi:parallel beta-helix repeat protein
MFKKASLTILAFLLLLSIVSSMSIGAQSSTSFIKTAKASLNEFLVNPGDSIQEAIDAASPGDTIVVSVGTYHEHLVINKSLTLKGAGSENTFIDGDGENKMIISIIASNVEVSGFTIQNGSKSGDYPYGGIQIMHASNVTIRNNVIRKNYFGIFLSESNFSDITENVIIDNYDRGIRISGSCYNHIVANNITNNPKGVWITSAESQNNALYRNNFIDNPTQVERFGNATVWDNGAEGNYWSDYIGTDANRDGIGDTPYPDEYGWDKHPLIKPWSLLRRHMVVLNGQIHNVTTHCNSTLASFNFNQSEKQISFNVTGPSGAVVFCNVTIPKILLNASSGSWTVFLEDANMTSSISVRENVTHTSIYSTFTFPPSTRNIRIIGTDVIPEFPNSLLFLIFTIITLIIIFLAKKKNQPDYS